MSLVDVYNYLYKLSTEINLFIPLGIVIGFTVLLIIFLKFKRLINPLKRAKILRERGNNLKALVYVDLFLEKNQLSKEGILLKADIETDLGLYAEAEGDYFRVLYTKTAGDGVDTLQIKKRLLKTLYEQDKIYQTFELAKEILLRERSCAEALFYLALIYMGQLYFREADKILKRLTLNRPKMPEAFYVQAINFTQLRLFSDAMASINRAIEIEDRIFYHLLKAAISYFDENYELAAEELGKLPNKRDEYDTRKQFIFFLKLNAMVNYRLRYFDRSVLMFKMAMDQLIKEKPVHKTGRKIITGTNVKKKGVLYGENGKLKSIDSGVFQANSISNSLNIKTSVNPVEEYEKRMGIRKNISPEIEEYYKLKELAVEEGKTELVVKRDIHDPFQLLDIDGLTDKSWINVSYGFLLVKNGRFEEANKFFKKMRKEHPEIIGLKHLIELIDEKIEDSKVSKIMVKSPDLTICLSVTKKQLENATCRSDLYNFILGLVSGYLILEKISRAFMKTVSESITF